MKNFGKNISNQVIAKIGKDDRRNGLAPQSPKGSYLKGYRGKKEGKRPELTASEHIALDLTSSAGEVIRQYCGERTSYWFDDRDIAS